MVGNDRAFSLDYGGIKGKLSVDNTGLTWMCTEESSTHSIPWTDIINIKHDANNNSAHHLAVDFVNQQADGKCVLETNQYGGELDKENSEELDKMVEENLAKIKEGRPKSLLVFINPNSGPSANGMAVYTKTVAPLFELANITTTVIETKSISHIGEVIDEFDFATVDGLVVAGGDGTILNVITAYYRRLSRDRGMDVDTPGQAVDRLAKPIGLLPTGSMIMITQETVGVRDMTTSALKIILGVTHTVNALSIHTGSKLACLSTIAVGLGLFGKVAEGAERLRWMGKFRFFIVQFNVLWNWNSFKIKGKLHYRLHEGEWQVRDINNRLMMFILVNMFGEMSMSKFSIRWPEDHLEVTISEDASSRWGFMNNFASLHGNKELIAANPGTTSVLEATECRLVFDEDVDLSEHFLMADGEGIPIPARDVYVKFHKDCIQLYGEGHKEHAAVGP